MGQAEPKKKEITGADVLKMFPPSPVDIPESKSGKVEIKHHFEQCVDVVSHREAMLTGKRPIRLTFDKPLRIHQLVEEGHGVWMTDYPIELRQMWDAIKSKRLSGHVLVGGLGLGIVASWLATEYPTRSVTVIEQSQDIINLVAPHLRGSGWEEPPPYRVIEGDLYGYIADLKKWEFTFAFMDIWQGTGESTWWEMVFPLRRMIAQKFGKQRVQYWAEDIMVGQLVRKFASYLGAEKKAWEELGRKVEWKPHWFYRMPEPLTMEQTMWFVRHVGLPQWEKKYGALYPEAPVGPTP